MLHARSLDLALQADRGEAVGGDGAPGAVHFAGQGAGRRVDGGHANLAGVVGFAVPAVAEMGFPVVVEVVIDFKAVQVRAPLHVVERFVETACGRDIQRVVGGRVDRRAPVKGGQKLAVFVGQQHLGVIAVPGQRRRNQGLAVQAKVAPVIFIVMIDDHPVRQPRITQRAGAVQRPAATVFACTVAGAFYGQCVVLLQLRLFTDHVDDTARVLDSIEQGRRPLEHFDPFGGRIQRPALHQRHAIAHDRAVTVVAKAAFHHRVLCTAQGVALGDTADVGQRIVQIARGLVADDLGGDHVDGLRDLHRRARAAHHRGAGWGLIAGVTDGLRGDAGGPQAEGAGLGPGLEGKGVGIGTASIEARLREHPLQGLVGRHAALDRRGLQAQGGFVGVDHAQAGQAAEVVEGPGQRLGGQIEIKQSTGLLRSGLRGHGDRQRR